jgi:MerR family transcriptional regulator, copper efflux regulator
MNIGDLSKSSGVTAKMIRYYEGLGIIPRAGRSPSGYRVYGEKDVHLLKFVKNAREMGFSMKEIKDLLSLWKNKKRSSRDVKKLTLKHIDELERKISVLQVMVDTLSSLTDSCQGDERPDCPILGSLENQFWHNPG